MTSVFDELKGRSLQMDMLGAFFFTNLSSSHCLFRLTTVPTWFVFRLPIRQRFARKLRRVDAVVAGREGGCGRSWTNVDRVTGHQHVVCG